MQYVDGHFVDSYYPTIENTFSKVITYRKQEFATEIIDTAGQVLDDFHLPAFEHQLPHYCFSKQHSLPVLLSTLRLPTKTCLEDAADANVPIGRV